MEEKGVGKLSRETGPLHGERERERGGGGGTGNERERENQYFNGC